MKDQKVFLFEVHGLRCPNINRILSEQGNAVVVVPGSFKLVATVFIEQSSNQKRLKVNKLSSLEDELRRSEDERKVTVFEQHS